jgi:hypothetical protein
MATRTTGYSPGQISAWLKALLRRPGQVSELRALDTPRDGTVSGYFDDFDKMAKAAFDWSGKARGVYFTPNACKPALIARSKNHVTLRAKITTSDPDIAELRYLLIDCDPIRPTGIASTDEEHALALQRAREVRDFLSSQGWPSAIAADSGNGGHTMYSVCLENNTANVTLLKNGLETLGLRFGCQRIKVDPVTFNAARIWRLYGTLNKKGDDLPDYPHRYSCVLEIPSEIVAVTKEQLVDLVDKHGPPQAEPPEPSSHGSRRPFDIDQWIVERGVDVKTEGPYGEGAYKWVIRQCPFFEDHGAGWCIIRRADGKIGASCRGARCAGKKWPELREHFEPGCYSRDRYGSGTNHQADGRPGKNDAGTSQESSSGQSHEYKFSPVRSQDFFTSDYRPRWLVRRILVWNQPCVAGGPKKVLKTSVLIDLAVSLATGNSFLGHFAISEPVRVVMLSGESGPHTLQETARRVAEAKGITNPETLNILWDFELPQLSKPGHLADLCRGLKAEGAQVLIFDPLYLSLLAGGTDLQASNLYDMGPLLLGISHACLDAGCTPILAHHTRRSSGTDLDPIELDDLAYAGISEFARQWLLLSRSQKYKPGSGHHELWLTVGGCIGHGDLWALTIDEGSLDDNFGGRFWKPFVRTFNEAKESTAEAKEQRAFEKLRQQHKADDASLLNTLDTLDPDRKGIGQRRLRDTLGMSGTKFSQSVARLLKDSVIEEVQLEISCGKGTRNVGGVRRATGSHRDTGTDRDGTLGLF